MDVKQFLTSAQILMQGGSEIDYRNAASRACAFHLCKNLVETLPISADNIATSHQKIIEALAHSHDNRLKALGNKLKVVRELRHKADYKVDMKFTRYEASRVLSHTQKIASEVENFLQSLH
jgi:uncharacterized protein (UPF0332 family)